MTSPRFGAVVRDAGVSFLVWAPAQTDIALVIDNGPELPMRAQDSGFFSADVADAREIGRAHV